MSITGEMNKKKGKRYEERIKGVSLVILKTVAVVGVIGVAAVAPNALQLLRFTQKGGRKKTNKTYYINKKVRELTLKGYVKRVRRSGKSCLELTKRGKRALAKESSLFLEKNKKRKWDGKWRVVIYDVYEKNRGRRNLLRAQLVALGFQKLQHSVWISPYESETLLGLLKSDLNLQNAIIYMTVESVENEDRLKKIFKL